MGGAGRQHASQASLQAGLPEEYLRAFRLELGGWFPALTWLIKEFRLQIGYETPDEEAGIRFWMDRFEPRKRTSMDLVPIDPEHWSWPTANEPALPATKEEVQMARRWVLEEAERRMLQFFELKRKICPQTPILVPLQQLKKYDTPRGYSSEQVRARLKEASSKQGSSATRPQSAGGRVKPRVLSREAKDRLFPSPPASGGQVALTDEQFASRIIDLAIEFQQDVLRATRLGPQFLAQGGVAATAEKDGRIVSPKQVAWREGLSRLEDLNLLHFWLQLGDKESMNLVVPADRAERALEERVSGRHFADKVLKMFSSRFRYECLDADVLYRLWQSMPKATRSAQHIRGMPDLMAIELLREATRKRVEQKELQKAKRNKKGKGKGQKAAGKGTGAVREGSRKAAWRPAA
eukprot:TRINITY_DN35706_c0_g1_i1.p1 TRINITY_DN35706_c0_g1~~TRINITY_DN35706_c0_g1_i1.p1  ORF type:complete len:407 (+),score=78.72 TRINITY_DN35706_c0_g1_i1:122-1342(+)